MFDLCIEYFKEFNFFLIMAPFNTNLPYFTLAQKLTFVVNYMFIILKINKFYQSRFFLESKINKFKMRSKISWKLWWCFFYYEEVNQGHTFCQFSKQNCPIFSSQLNEFQWCWKKCQWNIKISIQWMFRKFQIISVSKLYKLLWHFAWYFRSY